MDARVSPYKLQINTLGNHKTMVQFLCSLPMTYSDKIFGPHKYFIKFYGGISEKINQYISVANKHLIHP